MNKIWNARYLFLLLVFSFALTGCGINNSNNETHDHTIVEVQTGNDLIINTTEATEFATYYNYDMDGVTIQLFSVKASDGSVKVLLNTCGACNPSPNAYFIQIGEYFECQNCKNKYHRDKIGFSEPFGCAPIAVLDENKQVDKYAITISADFIATYKTAFESIHIYQN